MESPFEFEMGGRIEGLEIVYHTSKPEYSGKEKVIWICRNCGHIHEGPVAPAMCPTCAHPQAYFELRVINY